MRSTEVSTPVKIIEQRATKSSVNPESRTGKRDESGRERVVLGISQARSDFREPTCDDWKKFGKNKRAVAHTLN